MKQELLLQVLRDYGRVRIRALGTSMLPALWPGDVLDIERTDGGEIGGGAEFEPVGDPQDFRAALALQKPRRGLQGAGAIGRRASRCRRA